MNAGDSFFGLSELLRQAALDDERAWEEADENPIWPMPYSKHWYLRHPCNVVLPDSEPKRLQRRAGAMERTT